MLLDRPVEEIVASGEPDFPFATGWANQTWSGVWHGNPGHVLVEQRYPGPEDERAHFEYLLPMFSDPRHITVNGKPLFYISCPHLLPNPSEFVERWQAMATEAGLGGLYLIAEVSDLLGLGPVYTDGAVDGFDASVYLRMPADPSSAGHFARRVARKARLGELFRYHDKPVEVPDDPHLGRTFTTFYPGWADSPQVDRRAVILHGSAPEKFCPHARPAINRTVGSPTMSGLDLRSRGTNGPKVTTWSPICAGGAPTLAASAPSYNSRRRTGGGRPVNND